MDCSRMTHSPEDVNRTASRGEITWRLARALFVAAAVGITVWGWPLRPDPQFQYRRACTLLGSDPQRGKRLLRSLIDEAGGNFPDAQLQLALQATERGNWAELEALSTRLEWERGESNLLLTVGWKAVGAGRLDLARPPFEALRRREAAYAIAGLHSLATLCDLEQRPDEALQHLETITRIVPDNVHYWRLAAP